MKHIYFSIVLFLGLTACDIINSDIIVVHGEKKQTVWADDTEGADSIIIKTADAWMSFIRDPNLSSSITPDWISIDPAEGQEAGRYTIHITLEKNTTGEERTAVITLSCNESLKTISVTQKGTNKDGSTTVLPNFKESMLALVPAYNKTVQLFMQMDENYNTLNSRISLNPQTSALYEFWESAYNTIGLINVLLEHVDNQSQMTDVEKNTLKAECYSRRGNLYFILSILFGDIPVTLSSETHYTSVPQTVANNVESKSLSDLQQAIMMLPQSNNTRYYGAILLTLHQGNYHLASDYSRKMIEEGNMSIRDTNNDGVINDLDDNTFAIQWIFLAAESTLKAGYFQEAINYVNSTYRAYSQAEPLSMSSTEQEIMVAIQQKLRNNNDGGIKLMNAVRWGETSSWGIYAHLPIPQRAMVENPLLSQNPGW